MKTLVDNQDTRIAQTLIVDERLSQSQLQDSLDLFRKLRAMAIREVENRRESPLLDRLEKTIGEIEIDLLCRQIEDAEVEAIAIQYQLELHSSREITNERALRTLGIALNSSAQLLEGLHARLAYKIFTQRVYFGVN